MQLHHLNIDYDYISRDKNSFIPRFRDTRQLI